MPDAQSSASPRPDAPPPWLPRGERKWGQRSKDDPLRKVRLVARKRRFEPDTRLPAHIRGPALAAVTISSMTLGYGIAIVLKMDAAGSLLMPFLIVGVVAIILGDLLLLSGPWWLRKAIDALQADQLDAAKQAALLMLAVTAGGGGIVSRHVRSVDAADAVLVGVGEVEGTVAALAGDVGVVARRRRGPL